MDQLETRDIYKSATLMCLGAKLRESIRDDRGFSFILQGENLFKNDDQYRNKQTLIEPNHFRDRLNHLRDIVKNNPEHKERHYGTHSRF